MAKIPRIIEFLPGQDAGHVAGPLPNELIPRPDDYVGYFTNEHGEEIIFVQRPGEAFATVIHSDVDWKPVKFTDIDSLAGNGPLGSHVLTIGGRDGIILDEPEAAWLRACWLASDAYRQPTK